MSVDLAAPIFFAEIYDGESVWYEPVRLCTKRHRDDWLIDHAHPSYTFINAPLNGVHINRDGVLRIHYVETFDKLRSLVPTHHLLPENRSK